MHGILKAFAFCLWLPAAWGGQHSIARAPFGEGFRLSVEGKVFTSALPDITQGTTETDRVLIVNPSTSTKTLYILGYRAKPFTNTVKYKMYSNAVVASSGTSQPITNIISGGPGTSMQIYTSPTISSRGTMVERNEGGQTFMGFGLDQGVRGAVRIMPPGSTLLVTYQAGSNGIEAWMQFTWAELP